MPTPKEILEVKRPANTFVVTYGKNKDRYSVRERVICKSDDGRYLPVSGPTIGHIVDGLYVPIEKNESPRVEQKDWANIVLCVREFKSVQDELQKVYGRQDALALTCITILKVCNEGVADGELREAYYGSFLSELYKRISLSGNAAPDLMKKLGANSMRITAIMRNQVELERSSDLSPETIDKIFEKSGQMEEVRRFTNCDSAWDGTLAHGEGSVIGAEFCNFLVSLLTFRLIKAFDRKNILEKMTYKSAMSILAQAKKTRIEGEDWKLVPISPDHEEILRDLDLLCSRRTSPRWG